jgi:hypothetical protein
MGFGFDMPAMPDIGGLFGGGGGDSTVNSGGSGFSGGSGTGAGSNSGFGTKQSISQSDTQSYSQSSLESIDRRIVSDGGGWVVNAETGATLNLMLGASDPLAKSGTGQISEWFEKQKPVEPVVAKAAEFNLKEHGKWIALAVGAVVLLVVLGRGKK